MHIFNLHCQVVLRISSITKIYNITRINTSQCKIRIVADEGWFGQPKYSTPSKNHSDHVYLRHLSTEYRSILSADMVTNIFTDTWPICRPRLDRHQLMRMSADTWPIPYRHSATLHSLGQLLLVSSIFSIQL